MTFDDRDVDDKNDPDLRQEKDDDNDQQERSTFIQSSTRFPYFVSRLDIKRSLFMQDLVTCSVFDYCIVDNKNDQDIHHEK